MCGRPTPRIQRLGTVHEKKTPAGPTTCGPPPGIGRAYRTPSWSEYGESTNAPLGREAVEAVVESLKAYVRQLLDAVRDRGEELTKKIQEWMDTLIEAVAHGGAGMQAGLAGIRAAAAGKNPVLAAIKGFVSGLSGPAKVGLVLLLTLGLLLGPVVLVVLLLVLVVAALVAAVHPPPSKRLDPREFDERRSPRRLPLHAVAATIFNLTRRPGRGTRPTSARERIVQ